MSGVEPKGATPSNGGICASVVEEAGVGALTTDEGFTDDEEGGWMTFAERLQMLLLLLTTFSYISKPAASANRK